MLFRFYNIEMSQVNIGFAMFKPKIRRLLGKAMISQVEQLIDTSSWKITLLFRSDKGKQLWQMLFQQMTQTRVKQLVFTRNQFSQFFKCIPHINFIQLRILQLDHNGIENIESLAFLTMPKLEYLSLSSCVVNNNITTIKSYIRKSLFPNLTKIHFHKQSAIRSFLQTTLAS